MTIEKHGNKWRIRQIVDGKLYMVSVDHKPTKAEAVTLMSAQFTHPAASNPDQTFEDAAKAYIASKDNVLSPSTIRGYNIILKGLPEGFCAARLGTITAMVVQTIINELTASRTPKTVKNWASFIMAVLKAADIDIKQPRLPQKEKKLPYIPSEDDMKSLFAAVKGTRYEVPYALAALGLRLSELCALQLSDLDGCTLHITKALVMGEDDELVLKAPKTTDSTRDIVIPSDLADLIRQQGYVYKGNPTTLTKHLYILQDKLGMPRFSIHKLRHFFASYMHQQGFTDKQIQEAGGWRTDNIMKTVYQHAMEMDKAKAEMAGQISGLFS